jgi:hypothetical protein
VGDVWVSCSWIVDGVAVPWAASHTTWEVHMPVSELVTCQRIVCHEADVFIDRAAGLRHAVLLRPPIYQAKEVSRRNTCAMASLSSQ